MAESGRFRATRSIARWLALWPAIFWLVGCTMSVASLSAPPDATPAAVIAPSATPTRDHARLLAGLRPTASLKDAAGQCAALIGRAGEAARVRIETPKEQGCVPCNRLPIGSADRGIPAGEIALPLENYSWVWITVDDLLCVYLYEGQTFKPSSVTHW
ncbi:MAG: hypothetical protein N2439_08325 [Anaerolineae bacterium]|nr:hypothetical protein [Anaerolineae bacterium]